MHGVLKAAGAVAIVGAGIAATTTIAYERGIASARLDPATGLSAFAPAVLGAMSIGAFALGSGLMYGARTPVPPSVTFGVATVGAGLLIGTSAGWIGGKLVTSEARS